MWDRRSTPSTYHIPNIILIFKGGKLNHPYWCITEDKHRSKNNKKSNAKKPHVRVMLCFRGYSIWGTITWSNIAHTKYNTTTKLHFCSHRQNWIQRSLTNEIQVHIKIIVTNTMTLHTKKTFTFNQCLRSTGSEVTAGKYIKNARAGTNHKLVHKTRWNFNSYLYSLL